MKRFAILLLIVMLLMPTALADELRIKNIDWAYGRNLFVEALVEQRTDSGEYIYTVQKYGVIDLDGNIIIEPKWDNYYVFDEGMMCFESYDSEVYAVYDEAGECISTFNVPEGVDRIRQFENGFALIEVDGLWGYMDIYGEIVIEPKYEMDTWAGFEPDYYFEEKYNFSEGLAAVALDGKYGYIDETGEAVIPFIYAFDGGRAIVYYTLDAKEFRCGVIDTAGNWIIKPEWDEITKLENDVYCVKANGNYGVIDKTGQMIINTEYSMIEYDDELKGYILYMNPGYGTADEHGNIIIEPVYDYIGSYNKESALACKDGSIVLIDKAGNEITVFAYDLTIMHVIQIGEGYIRFSVTKDGTTDDVSDEDYLYGVFSSSGEVIAEPVYDRVGGYSCGRINVCKDDKWGYIDAEGNVVIDLIYDRAWEFGGDIAPVKLGDKIGFIDLDGNTVTDFIWNECVLSWANEMVDGNPCYEFDGEYRYAVRKGTDWHIIDNEGNIIR